MASDHPAASTASASPASSDRWRLLLLLAAAACLFFARLGSLALVEPDEGRNAEVAREMLASGDWLAPHFDTLPYLDKPALFFWLVAASFRVWGLSEWAARFPSALAAMATVFLIWLLARRMFGGRVALRAGLVWATSPLVIAFARLVIFDMTLTFLVTAALTCFWFRETSDFPRRWLDAGLFGAMGLATFEKGPVGFILPLLSIAAYAAARGRFRDLKRLRWGLGLVIFAATGLPWFVFTSIRHPEFLRYAVWETWLRFATTRARRAGGPFYYIPVFLGGFLPWSFFSAVRGVESPEKMEGAQRRSSQAGAVPGGHGGRHLH